MRGLHDLADLLFGFDYFISYAHADGRRYAAELSRRLEALGFSVFLDERVYVAGDDLHSATRRRIRMSKKLVVVVRDHALASEWVGKEVEVALARGGADRHRHQRHARPGTRGQSAETGAARQDLHRRDARRPRRRARRRGHHEAGAQLRGHPPADPASARAGFREHRIRDGGAAGAVAVS